MTRSATITHEFVDYIPDNLEDGVLYISIAFATAAHLCCCGCRREVTTPFTRTDWKLIYDGESVSLQPSIGNWSFPCQSHYIITGNRVRWVDRWSPERIAQGRQSDIRRKRGDIETNSTPTTVAERKHTWWRRLLLPWRR